MSALFPFTGDSLSLIEVIYLGYFGRAGDPGGVNFWNNYFQSGGTLQAISASFSVQDEARAQYPFLADPLNANTSQIQGFLHDVYENLVSRGPDAGGLAFWTTQIQNGLNSGDPIVIANEVGFVITQIAFGAQAADQAVLQNKITASDFLTQTFAQDGINEFPNPSSLFTFAHTNIASVGASLASVSAAEQAAISFPIVLSSALTGPLVLSNVTNGALVGDGFGAGNDVRITGSGGADDAFTMTATSVAGQDWGSLF